MISSIEQNNQKKHFFIILTPSEGKVNFDLKFVSENSPKSIYKKNIEKEKDYILEYNVFKLNIKKGKRFRRKRKRKRKRKKRKK